MTVETSPPLTDRHRVVVVGGSIAGVTAASALRAQGFGGELVVLSAEQHAPYSRVPLSKSVLTGAAGPQSTALAELDEDVELRRGVGAASLSVAHRRVTLDDGTGLTYDGLVLATGAQARRLSRPGQTGEHVVRTLDDVAQLQAQLARAGSVVVVGGGFLGMEVASSCMQLGLDVTVVTVGSPLEHLLGRQLATLVVEVARGQGVRFVRAATDVRLAGDHVVTGVHVDGRVVQADVVVSAVGDTPAIGWLAGSGLPIGPGVVVDQQCRVVPRVVAAGDVTSTRHPDGSLRRSPRWTDAVQQGRAAAAALLGAPDLPDSPVPYAWTEQFGLDVKVCGTIPTGGPPPILLEGDPGHGTALFQWQRAAGPVAAAAVGVPVPVVRLRRLAGAGTTTAPVAG